MSSGGIERDDGACGRVGAKTGNRVGADLGGPHRLADRRYEGRPPVIRVLFGPPGSWMLQLVGGGLRGQAAAGRIKHRSATALGAEVDPEQVGPATGGG